MAVRELSISEVSEMTAQPDFQRAWEIHGKYYGDTEGEITDDDRDFFDKFVVDLSNKMRDEEIWSFSINLWLVYASQYVRNEDGTYNK
jgi:hypothetical protein